MAQKPGPQLTISESAREAHLLIPNTRGVMTPVLNRHGEPDNLYGDLAAMGKGQQFAQLIRRIAKGCDVEIPPTVDHSHATDAAGFWPGSPGGAFTRERFEEMRRRAHQGKYGQW